MIRDSALLAASAAALAVTALVAAAAPALAHDDGNYVYCLTLNTRNAHTGPEVCIPDPTK